MAQAQAGDGAAYARLLSELLPPLRRYVRRWVREPAAGEDVVQEILLSIHRMRASYDPQRELLPWIYAIARSRTIDHLRRQMRLGEREQLDEAVDENHCDNAAEASRQQLEAADQLRELMHELPERQRRVVELVHLQEMSLADAAGASRLSVSAIKSILHRALTSLRSKAKERS